MLTKLSVEQLHESPERFLGVLDVVTLEFELDAFREFFLTYFPGLERTKPCSQ